MCLRHYCVKLIRRSGALWGSAGHYRGVLAFPGDFVHLFSSVLSLPIQNSTQHKCCITTAEMQTCVARTVTETATSTISLVLSLTTLKPGSDAISASESTYSQLSLSFSYPFEPCESLALALSSIAHCLPGFGNADAGVINRAFPGAQLGNSRWGSHRPHHQRKFSSIPARLPDLGTEQAAHLLS